MGAGCGGATPLEEPRVEGAKEDPASAWTGCSDWGTGLHRVAILVGRGLADFCDVSMSPASGREGAAGGAGRWNVGSAKDASVSAESRVKDEGPGDLVERAAEFCAKDQRQY